MNKKYGIQIEYEDGTRGLITENHGEYLLFDTPKAAERAMKQMKNNDEYTWNCKVSVKAVRCESQ